MVDSSDTPTRATRADDVRETDRQWADVMHRGIDLLPFFAETRLNVSASRVARAIGVRRAQGLAQLLRKRELPPFKLFRNWIYIVQLVERAECDDKVAHWAMHRGEYPGPYYRLVALEVGESWSVVAERGCQWCRSEALRRWQPYTANRLPTQSQRITE